MVFWPGNSYLSDQLLSPLGRKSSNCEVVGKDRGVRGVDRKADRKIGAGWAKRAFLNNLEMVVTHLYKNLHAYNAQNG